MNEKKSMQNLVFIAISQFWVNLSFNFMFAFLPFYLNEISRYSQAQTLMWTGAILGATSLCAAFSGPFWGSVTDRISPKLLYLIGIAFHCITFLFMAYTRSLPVFLVFRVLQGVFGGTATIGLIMISFSQSRKKSRDIGIFQTSITLGQLLGPVLGSMAVSILGYEGGFLAAAAAMGGTLLVSYFFISDVTCKKSPGSEGREARFNVRIIATYILCLVAQIQLMFLPTILPTVFRSFRLDQISALHWAGLLITLYTVTSMAGTYVWSVLAPRVGVTRMISLLMIGGIVLQGLLLVPGEIIGYSIVRMAQTGLIAAVIPLAIALFAGRAGGFTLGFLYSSRFVGNAIGPIMAASVVAYLGIPALYLSICVISLATLFAFRAAAPIGQEDAPKKASA